jgi:two-component system, NtrC family, response regulator HydG
MQPPTQTSTTGASWRRDAPPPPLPSLIGQSEAHRDMLGRLDELVGLEPALAVLVGETGTGKSLVAREFHRRSRRRDGPFHLLPCGTLPGPALEEELFGAPDGRFSGALEAMAGGTIHLDDADRLSPELAHRLRRHVLRAPPEAPVLLLSSRRVVRPGGEEDLWETFPVLELPPLRLRGADIEMLARLFLRAWASDRGLALPVLEDAAVAALHEHPWPGNVRELRDTMERAAEVAPGIHIREEHLRIRTRDTRPLHGDAAPATEMIRIPPHGKSMEEIEGEAVRATLRITGGNRSQAARILGVSRPTLARKIRIHGAEREGLG